MSGGRRHRIPPGYRDMSAWPAPDIMALPEKDQPVYAARRKAIQLYAAGVSFDEIRQQTGIVQQEVHRQLARCVTLANDGDIMGFFALVPGTRVGSYQRRAPVIHQPGSGSGGCSGAFTALLERFPEIAALIEDLFFKEYTGTAMQEARIGRRGIFDKFKKALRDKGLSDNDWPFNTATCGYKTLCRYLHDLEMEHTQRAMAPRHGRQAASRSQVGNGIEKLFPKLRPFGAVQLDFHKVDAASVFTITNELGVAFHVPLSRWHFGLLIEERTSAVLGYAVVLELNPSGDATLETINSALIPNKYRDAMAVMKGGQAVLIHQLMPALSYQCFSVLKVDNAWANVASEVVNNIIGTVGCAVNFGPSYAWWHRPQVERIFGALTRRGIQRLPSTYGSRPGDPIQDDPHAQAARFEIVVDDLIRLFEQCIREHNLTATEGLQWTSPLQALEAAWANPGSGLMPQPLPYPVQQHPSLMMHIEEVTVLGSVEKNIRPYFNFDRHKHTNAELANAYWLIGQQLVIYVDRRLARMVWATVKGTGQNLGQMRLQGPWADSDCSLRDRKLLARAGMAAKNMHIGDDPLDVLVAEKEAQIKAQGKRARKKTSRLALDMEKIARQKKRAADLTAAQQAQEHEDDEEEAGPGGPIPDGTALRPDEPPKPPAPRDTFGINDIPSVD